MYPLGLAQTTFKSAQDGGVCARRGQSSNKSNSDIDLYFFIFRLLQAVTEEKKPKSEMASDRLSRRKRERATPAFKLGDNCRDELLALQLSGALLAIRAGVGFSGALNAMVMTPETHSSCIYAQCSVRNALRAPDAKCSVITVGEFKRTPRRRLETLRSSPIDKNTPYLV